MTETSSVLTASLIEAARTTVLHDGFAAGAVFTALALLVAVALLPRIPHTHQAA